MSTLITKVRVGESGQIVIPKIMRESMGIVPKREVNLSMGDGRITIIPQKTGLAEHCKSIANECGLKKGEKLLTGCELYDQVFSEKYGLHRR
jgi:AbrB family looped-hinge helix DNA binding protein